jgi:hypothetical protein
MSIGMHVGQEVIKSAADLDGVESPRRELGTSIAEVSSAVFYPEYASVSVRLKWSFINVRGRHALLDDSLPDYP